MENRRMEIMGPKASIAHRASKNEEQYSHNIRDESVAADEVSSLKTMLEYVRPRA